jgi:homocysteine S-methyltransferase
LPPLVDSHRPDLTEDAYLKEGQAFFEKAYETICEALSGSVDLFLAETMSTEQEMLCAVRAAAKQNRPVVVAMAAALRNRELEPVPARAAAVTEFVLQEVEQGRADIPTLCFNCGPPEMCTQAVEAITAAQRQRLRDAKVALGVYANLNSGAEKRQATGFDASKQRATSGETVSKIARREDLTDAVLENFCDEWTRLGVTRVGGCCGSTPEDIAVIAAKLKPAKI